MPQDEFMNRESIAKTFIPFITKEGGINKGCKYVAIRLKGRWSWKYLYHVYRGTVKPSASLERKLKSLAPPKPKPKRYRMITEALSREQYESWPKTMEERRNALDNHPPLGDTPS